MPQLPKSIVVHKIQTAIFTEDLLSFYVEKFTFARPPLSNENLIHRAEFILNGSEIINIRVGFFNPETNKKSNTLKDVTFTCNLGSGVKFYQK